MNRLPRTVHVELHPGSLNTLDAICEVDGMERDAWVTAVVQNALRSRLATDPDVRQAMIRAQRSDRQLRLVE